MNRVQLNSYREPDEAEIPQLGAFGGYKVQRYGGWTWTHEGIEYRTDREGGGLWHRRQSDGDWVQDQGTGQFSLPRDRQKAIRTLHRDGLSPDAIA